MNEKQLNPLSHSGHQQTVANCNDGSVEAKRRFPKNLNGFINLYVAYDKQES